MNPPSDPSGAARAPQPLTELLAEVKEALDDVTSEGRVTLLGQEIVGPRRESLERHAPEWLGAWVQAVEDQQRALDGFAHAAYAVLEGDSHVGTTPEMVAANRHRLAVLAGQYDRPVTARSQ